MNKNAILQHLKSSLDVARNSAIPNKEDVVACLEMTLADVGYWLEVSPEA